MASCLNTQSCPSSCPAAPASDRPILHAYISRRLARTYGWIYPPSPSTRTSPHHIAPDARRAPAPVRHSRGARAPLCIPTCAPRRFLDSALSVSVLQPLSVSSPAHHACTCTTTTLHAVSLHSFSLSVSLIAHTLTDRLGLTRCCCTTSPTTRSLSPRLPTLAPSPSPPPSHPPTLR
ncbi:hypothetical protein BV20DRAFT_628495 [Pilatotrama ljubarskyi]|nr:hypothetical protein BV20DRAFT_628495 [Pilatotrama ljubarskyi]